MEFTDKDTERLRLIIKPLLDTYGTIVLAFNMHDDTRFLLEKKGVDLRFPCIIVARETIGLSPKGLQSHIDTVYNLAMLDFEVAETVEIAVGVFLLLNIKVESLDSIEQNASYSLIGSRLKRVDTYVLLKQGIVKQSGIMHFVKDTYKPIIAKLR
ncbi:hypothetical protein D3C81_07700 [compost metagenome]